MVRNMMMSLAGFILSFSLSVANAAETVVPLNQLRNLNGETFAEPKGQKVLLYFWASWCPDCRQKLRGELNGLKEVEVIAVNSESNLEKVKDFLVQEKEIRVPVVQDADKALRKKLQIVSVPSWVALEKKSEGWVITKQGTGDLALAGWLQ